MSAVARLCYSSLPGHYQNQFRHFSGAKPIFTENICAKNLNFNPLRTRHKWGSDLLINYQIPCASGSDGGSIGMGRGSGGGDSGHGRDWSGGGEDSDDSWDSFGPIGAFVNGWRSRVAADPQFPFKVLMEELVGVTSAVIGDMASRPNFGLNELDFVFSTLVVGSILNFVLMYILAPTSAISNRALPSIFASCPPSHMFEPGAYSLLSRVGTLVYKGTLFAAVGFAAGLVGTAISNGLIKMRKKMDPNFETPNKPPPTLLNAVTWATHMGVSSNLRYQTLNGIEFLLDKALPSVVFKTSVVVLRCLNNVLGGMSFVMLARLTGSQSVDKGEVVTVEEKAEKERLLNQSDNIQTVDSVSKK
ncbi:putative LRR receptor-like serine/threonine-protein kinase-like [Capsicum annuum]|uniref:protein RETICULATA-RELATED 3, chloroplastic n=1 Tax=Capsicum annuum TaxID=4072 RepID=UPI001FB18CB8|nr:protein RETICULATA-RELATED 3, chloroplastic [Capsicum annuum]XP_047265321.1 protein RETICULATA-RELATED 3, chloroplastic [Capsicum annuum]KAF3673438.1 putative LRR receptor-like serine/threonine-protein kinase-like [Capsicum annuum]